MYCCWSLLQIDFAGSVAPVYSPSLFLSIADRLPLVDRGNLKGFEYLSFYLLPLRKREKNSRLHVVNPNGCLCVNVYCKLGQCLSSVPKFTGTHFDLAFYWCNKMGHLGAYVLVACKMIEVLTFSFECRDPSSRNLKFLVLWSLDLILLTFRLLGYLLLTHSLSYYFILILWNLLIPI